MGTSTDAYLFYGYCWDINNRLPPLFAAAPFKRDEYGDLDADEEWEDVYTAAMGVAKPSRPYPRREAPRTRENGYDSTPKDYSIEEQTIIDEYTAWWQAKHEVIAASGVELDTHCSCECPMPMLVVKASFVRAWRGDPVTISNLEIKPEWDAQLAEFIAVLGIDVGDQKPRWWLCSMWC